MTPKTNWMELSALCALFIVLSLVGIVWNITSGLLTSGIDGIMLLFICLMMGGIFSIMLLVMLWQAGVIPAFRHTKAAASATAKTEAPAKAPADLRAATQASDQEVKAPAAKPPAATKPSPPPSPTPTTTK